MLVMMFAATFALGCGGKGEEAAKTEGGENKEAAAPAAETKAPKDLIARAWHVNADKIEIPAGAKPEQIEKAKAAMQAMVFEFKADGTSTVSGGPDKSRSGKWKVSDDGKTLTMIDEKGKEDTSTIEALSETEFVIATKGGKIHLKP